MCHFRLVGIALVAPDREQRRVQRDFGVDAGLLDHLRIARGECLDLGVGRHGEFHVIDRTLPLSPLTFDADARRMNGPHGRAVALNPLMVSKPGAIEAGFPLAGAYRPGNTEPV